MPFLWDDSLPWRKTLWFPAWRLRDWLLILGLLLPGGRGWGACVLRRQMFTHLFLTFNRTPPFLSGFSFLKDWGIVALRCCVSSTVQWNESATYIHIYPSFWTHPPLSLLDTLPHQPTHVGHHRALSWAPWALQQVPTSYLHMVIYICKS